MALLGTSTVEDPSLQIKDSSCSTGLGKGRWSRTNQALADGLQKFTDLHNAHSHSKDSMSMRQKPARGVFALGDCHSPPCSIPY